MLRPKGIGVEDPRTILERPLPIVSQSVVELSWEFFSHQPPEYAKGSLTAPQSPVPVKPQSVPIPVDLFEIKKSQFHPGPVIIFPISVPKISKSTH